MAVNQKQNPDLSMGLAGTDAGDGEFIPWTFNYINTTGTTNSGPVFSRRMIVKGITGIVDTAASNAVTATVYKASSGTALASGTAVHSGTFNTQGTANANQSLTLSTVSGVTDVAAGQRVGVVLSGSLGAAGVGAITVWFAPA